MHANIDNNGDFSFDKWFGVLNSLVVTLRVLPLFGRDRPYIEFALPPVIGTPQKIVP